MNSSDKLFLFMYTMDEYKRFFNELCSHSLVDEYDEKAYIQTHIKLMLLRKYGTRSENVYIVTVIDEAIKKYSEQEAKWKILLDMYHEIENRKIEHILPDGTKLNLYQTIEDVMYGLYLHADKKRIERLLQTDETMRFICVRDYVESLEEVIFKVYDLLKWCGEEYVEPTEQKRATVLYLGDKEKSVQAIKKSEYWSNLYGHDAEDEDIDKIVGQLESEDLEIHFKCQLFLELLKKEKISFELMDLLILPATKCDWGDFSEARLCYSAIKKPGISTKVRYNEEHNRAYVRIFQQVDDFFVIDSPHVINDFFDICLVKENEVGDWRIHSLNGNWEV